MNEYIASFKSGMKIKKIPCKYLKKEKDCTVIIGIPNGGSVGYETVLASIPNKIEIWLE